MFDSIVLSHDFVKRVTIEASHEENDHSGALPPGVLLAATLWEQQSGGEANSNRLPCTRPLEANELADTISQRQECKQIEESN